RGSWWCAMRTGRTRRRSCRTSRTTRFPAVSPEWCSSAGGELRNQEAGARSQETAAARLRAPAPGRWLYWTPAPPTPPPAGGPFSRCGSAEKISFPAEGSAELRAITVGRRGAGPGGPAMPAPGLSATIARVHLAVAPPAEASPTDGQLLSSFVADRDPQ